MLPTMFQFIWQSGFRGEIFQKSTNQKQELPVVAMFVNKLEQNAQRSQRTFHKCFLPSLVHLAKWFYRISFSQKSTNQKQELPVAALFVNGSGQNQQSLQRTSHRCFLPSLVHLAKRFQRRRFFRNQPIKNKNCLWWPSLFVAVMFVYRSGRNEQSLQRTFHGCFPPSFSSFG